MSAPEPQVVVTSEAQADLASIALYTAERWGSRQRDVYIEPIVTAMNDLPRFPGRGQLREEHGDGVRACPVQQHVMTILRVLHSRMDAGLLLEE